MPRMRWLAISIALLVASCGGTDATEPSAGRADVVPQSFEDAKARLAEFIERRLSVSQTDDVETLMIDASEEAAESVEEAVAIAEMFDHVVRENGERWRARCLVGIASANRAMAVLIRNLEYQVPRDVEAELRAIAEADPEEAADARTTIIETIDEALDARAVPLDRNECTALRGAVAALREHPDPEVDREAIIARIEAIPDCP